MVSTVLMLAFALTAAITDVWRQKIYNWTTLPGILTGLIVSTVEPNGIGWEESLLGLVGCGLVMVCCFVCFPAMGGGDVKLIAMLATFLGWYHGLECMLWSFVLGSGLGLSMLVWNVGIIKLLRWTGSQLWALIRYRTWLPLTAEQRAALAPKLFFAPAALVAAMIVRFSWFR
jgi:prepilin peptidase CpaA